MRQIARLRQRMVALQAHALPHSTEGSRMTVDDFILQNEMAIRLGFFFGVFAIMGLWEILAPRRALTVSKAVRWANNLGLVFLNSVILRLIFPMAAVGVAAFAAEQG